MFRRQAGGESRLRSGRKCKKVYTYGPIIHNEEVVSDLERKGVHVLSEEDIDAMLAHDGREDDAKEIVIRSHGIGRDAYKKLEQLGFEIVDATCPFVKKFTVSYRRKLSRDIVW